MNDSTAPLSISSSDPAIESVPPEKRKCLFPHEKSLDLFESYSFSNCQLECSLQQAANTTRCLPWFRDVNGTSRNITVHFHK